MPSDGKPRSAACASCDVDAAQRACMSDAKQGAKGCPTLTAKDALALANQEYDRPEVRSVARAASILTVMDSIMRLTSWCSMISRPVCTRSPA